MKLKVLIGNGRKIGILALPFLIIGLIMNSKRTYHNWSVLVGETSAVYRSGLTCASMDWYFM
jgi:hypothetical protein